jgi:hypothetical protein
MAATHRFDEMTGKKQIQETSKHSSEVADTVTPAMEKDAAVECLGAGNLLTVSANQM